MRAIRLSTRLTGDKQDFQLGLGTYMRNIQPSTMEYMHGTGYLSTVCTTADESIVIQVALRVISYLGRFLYFRLLIPIVRALGWLRGACAHHLNRDGFALCTVAACMSHTYVRSR